MRREERLRLDVKRKDLSTRLGTTAEQITSINRDQRTAEQHAELLGDEIAKERIETERRAEEVISGP